MAVLDDLEHEPILTLAGYAPQPTPTLEPDRWPGDTRPLWQRALEVRAEAARAKRSERGRRNANGIRYNIGRKYPPLEVGDVCGSWCVTRVIGRGHKLRSDVRVEVRCSCGLSKEVYEYHARKETGRCRHRGARDGAIRNGRCVFHVKR